MPKLKNFKLIFFCFLSLFLFSQNSSAQVVDSVHYSWTVFEFEEESEDQSERIKRCYLMARPENTQTNYTGERDAYLSVTRFDHDRSEEVSISAGFEYKGSSKVYAVISEEEFEFFTKRDGAWLDRAIKDRNFIEKMLTSNTIKVRSDSAFGSYAVDEYSLQGFNRAYKRMKKLCP